MLHHVSCVFSQKKDPERVQIGFFVVRGSTTTWPNLARFNTSRHTVCWAGVLNQTLFPRWFGPHHLIDLSTGATPKNGWPKPKPNYSCRLGGGWTRLHNTMPTLDLVQKHQNLVLQNAKRCWSQELIALELQNDRHRVLLHHDRPRSIFINKNQGHLSIFWVVQVHPFSDGIFMGHAQSPYKEESKLWKNTSREKNTCGMP